MRKLLATILACLVTTANAQTGLYTGPAGGFFATALPSGITATTTAYAGDSTAKIATNAFVQAANLLAMSTVPMAVSAGTYSFATVATVNPTINQVAAGGAITSATVNAGGTGVAVGDLFLVSGGNQDAILRVATVSGGAALTLNIVYGGTGYSTANGVTTDAGSATPFTYLLSGALAGNVTIIATSGTYLTASQQWYFANNTTNSYTVTVCVSNGSDACSSGRTAIIPQGSANSRIVGVQTDGKLNVDIASVVNAADLTGTTLPSSVTGSSLTSVGALASGSLASGFTVVGPALGGTGVTNNAASTITLSAYPLAFTYSGSVSLTLPTSGTLATTAAINTALPNITAAQLYGGTGGAGVAQEFTMGVGVLGNTLGTAAPSTLTTLPAGLGGTGIANNAANTITITGPYPLGLALSGATELTLPASGTLATTATFAAPPAIGNTTPSTGAFTTLSATGALTLSNAIAPNVEWQIGGTGNYYNMVLSDGILGLRYNNAFPGLMQWDSANNNRLSFAYTGLADDFANVAFYRTTSYSGGSNSSVNFNTYIESQIGAGNENYEWNAGFKLDNSSTIGDASQNNAFYAQSFKRSTGETWGGTIELDDFLANPTGESQSLEIDMWANGADANGQRGILDLVLGCGVSISGCSGASAYRGLRIGAVGGVAADGTFAIGLAFGGATYSNALIGYEGSLTVVNEVNFSGITCSGEAWQSTGVFVDCSGHISQNTTSVAGGLNAYLGSTWGGANYGTNIIVGGTSHNNAIGIFDGTNANPWAIVNNGGILKIAQMPALGDTSTFPMERLSLLASGALALGNATDAGVGGASINGKIIEGNSGITGAGLSLQNNVGTCTFTATASGSATQACSSDERLKIGIRDAESKLSWLDSFRIRDYTVRASGEPGTSPIAQEVQAVHPEMVTTGIDDMLQLQAPSPWKMLKVIQELKADNDNLRAEVYLLRAEFGELLANRR